MMKLLDWLGVMACGVFFFLYGYSDLLEWVQ